MIAAFVKAEIHSPRFGEMYRQFVKERGWPRGITDNPNLGNGWENDAREAALNYVRGYPDAGLFSGFPANVAWHRATISPGELGGLYYADHSTWATLTEGSRLVSDGADNVHTIPTGENANQNIIAVAARVYAGESCPELLCVAVNRNGPVVLFDGQTRATAYLQAGSNCPNPVRVLIGLSPAMATWHYFGSPSVWAG